ncbi:FHA domain protein [Desulfovibrio sp. DV]|uniref:FHA domain-containing protein n=1 Tax=Desulfovibrio sp. DV TaxID=1844708 RepID=UPI00094B814E|nr:FHA domain-containing protein [Desulfovibrio sp. DV]OLN30392.1 FHA domain protein [Desulfovibrio sp. DV]
MTSSQEDRTIIRPLVAFRLTVRGPSGHEFQAPLAPGVLTIGRDATCGLPLDPADVSVSRRHASLTVDGETITVTDLGSTNGVFVNAVKVEQAVLAPGDAVRLGQTVLLLESAVPSAPLQSTAGDAPPKGPGRSRSLGNPPKARLFLTAAALAALFLVVGLVLFPRPDTPAPVSHGPEQETKAAATEAGPQKPAAQALAPQPSDQPAASAEAVENAKDLTRQGLFFYNNNNIAAAIGEWEKALALDPQNTQAAKWLARAASERDQLLDKYSREGLTALKYARFGEAKDAFRLVTEYCRGQSADQRCLDAAKQLEQLEGKAP